MKVNVNFLHFAAGLVMPPHTSNGNKTECVTVALGTQSLVQMVLTGDWNVDDDSN